MPSFEDVFDVPLPDAEAEASIRARHPEAFAEEGEPPAAELLEPNEFRYDGDGTHHRQLQAGEREALNEGHLSAHGREAAMARMEAVLDGVNEERAQASVAATTATPTTVLTATRTCMIWRQKRGNIQGIGHITQRAGGGLFGQ